MRYEARVWSVRRDLRWARPRLLDIAYEYPYHRARFQWSNIEGAIAYWTFLLPVDERATRVFFVFCYDRLRPDFSPLRPRARVGAGASPTDPARGPSSPRSGWLRARSGAGGMGSPLRATHPGPQPGRRARRAPDDRKVGSVPGPPPRPPDRALARRTGNRYRFPAPRLKTSSADAPVRFRGRALRETADPPPIDGAPALFAIARTVTGRVARRGPGGWGPRALPAPRDYDTAAKEWERLPG